MGNRIVLRFFDICISVTGLIIGLPVFATIYFLILLTNEQPLFKQERVGKHKKPFIIIKFRTMKTQTPSTPTHLVNASSVTKLGKFLRKSKLDEIPQLWNVLKGEMSIVGPRPNLFTQRELITERSKKGVYNIRPGITGLAQLNNIDMSNPILLAKTDKAMIQKMTVLNYFKIILKTLAGGGSGDPTKK